MWSNFQFIRFVNEHVRREGLGKEMEVAHTVVRWREQNMHGRIFVPGIGEKKRR